MPPLHHSVRRETLHVTVDSETLARTLQPRLQDVNRTTLMQVIERVFDEFAAPDQHVRIARLSIDLGTIPGGDLEWVLVERLERELREALRSAIGTAEIDPPGESRTQPSRDAQLEAVERYLLTGTLPFWASTRSFTLDDSIRELVSTNPDGLVRLFRRRGSNSDLFRRMVHQLSDACLRELLVGPVFTELGPDFVQSMIEGLADTDARVPEKVFAAILESWPRRLEPQSTDQSPAIFSRYDRAEALHYFLRYGTLPWSVSLREPALALADLLDVLTSLPVSILQTMLRDLWPDERVEAWYRVVSEMSDARVQGFIAALIAQTDGLPVGASGLAALLVAQRPLVFSLRTPADVLAALRQSGQNQRRQGTSGADAAREGRPPGATDRDPFHFRRLRDASPQYVAAQPAATAEAAARTEAAATTEAAETAKAPAASEAAPATAEAAAATETAGAADASAVTDATAAGAASETAAMAAPMDTAAATTASVNAAAATTEAAAVSHAAAVTDAAPATHGAPGPPAQVDATDTLLVFARSIAGLLDASEWDAHRIRSVLRGRARAATGSRAHTPSSLSLLLRLIEMDAESARQFVRALKDAGLRPSSLVDDVLSPSDVDLARMLLSPEAALSVTLVIRMLSAFLHGRDVGVDAGLRAVILGEALDHDTAVEIGPAVLASVLRRLFAPAFPQGAGLQMVSRFQGMWRELAPEARLHSWRQLVGEMSDVDLQGLVDALMLGTDVSERADVQRQTSAATGWSGLSAPMAPMAHMAHAAHAADRAVVFARVIASLLDKEAIDDAEGSAVRQAAGVDTREFGSSTLDASEWDGHRIMSVLRARARAGAGPRADEPSSITLLQRLVDADVEAAREFVRDLRDAGLRPSSLIDDDPPARAADIVELLLPVEAARSVAVLSRVLSAFPHADGPGLDAGVRALILGEALDHDPAEEFAPAIMASVLRRLFGSTVATATNDQPISRFQAMWRDLRPNARVDAWRRVAGELDDADLEGIVAALIAQADAPAASMWARVSSYAEQATDKALVLARFISDLLEEGMVDGMGERALRQARRAGTIDASGWEAHRIKSVLGSRVRFGARAGADEPSSTNLLLKLIEQDVEAARQFVRALKDAGLRPSSMVHDVSSASAIEIAQRLLPAEAASTSSLLFRMLWSLPPAHRPFPDAAMNAVVLGEALDHGGAEEFGPAAVARVLRRIFGSTIAQETLDVLIATATHLRDSGEFPSAQVQGVKAAFELLMTPGEDEPPKKAAPDVALSHDESIALEWLQHPEDVPDAPGPTRLADDALRHAVLGAIDRAPGMVRRVLLERVGDRHARLRWATILSESELVRLAHVLEPRGHRVLLEAAELLFSSWLSVTPDRSSASTHRPAFWSFFLQALSGVSGSESSLERMVRSFFVDFGAHDRSKTESSPGSQGRGAATGAALVDAAAVVAAEAGSTALRAILERERATLLALWRGDSPASSSATDVRPPLLPGRGDLPARGGRVRGRAAFSMVDESADIGDEPIYIANAGLILASPFLPQLFQALDMLEPTEGGKSRVIADQISRATHLLQWLVDGRTSAPEPLLCLNKLLCGVPLPTPVERTIEPTPRDLEVCSTLLTSMIANWPIIRNTSIEGLRETFLQREGRLQQSPDGWRLHVQRKTLDVLLDQIPWSISTIVHAWMPAPIFVTW